jgi:hypothetical protein
MINSCANKRFQGAANTAFRRSAAPEAHRYLALKYLLYTICFRSVLKADVSPTKMKISQAVKTWDIVFFWRAIGFSMKVEPQEESL